MRTNTAPLLGIFDVQQRSWEAEHVLSVLLAQASSGKVALSWSRLPAGTPPNLAGSGRRCWVA